MKSLLLLWSKLAHECANGCCTSATMDVKTVHERTKHEGLSFLMITLPDFGKGLQKALEQGHVDPSTFAGFAYVGGLPRFLGGFLDRVFDRSSGVLLSDPCIDAILSLRQLTLMFGKVSSLPSDRRRRKAMREFIQCEQEVRVADIERSPIDLERFHSMSAKLFTNVFQELDRKVYAHELHPKHGPGVTADRLLGNQKYNQRTWTTRLEEILPAGEYLLPSWSYYDQLSEVDFLEPEAEIPVRVVSVPKTMKTPRIIAIEPTAMQYMQQAIYDSLLDCLQEDDFLRSVIGFDDQTPNQRMAKEGSFEKSMATLDLSEASDRVSNQLVREMLRNFPHLHRAVDACRSRKADVQGHGVVRLAKFASMGSALCFPFEAMVFTTLIFMGIEQSLNTSLCRRDLEKFRRRVRVYGDDIIVPVDHVRSVVTVLESFGTQVNRSKSFWNGKFRESCGREYYDGHDVSIVRIRQAFPTQRKDATGVISIVSLRNQLYLAGYWDTVRWLDDYIRDLIKHFPVVLPSSPVQGRHSFLGYETQKICARLHRPLVKGYVVNAPIPRNSIEGYGALLKCLLKRGEEPFVDSEHLERSGRPYAVNIKLGYASPV